MIWFDWFCRQASSTLSPEDTGGDPRRGMALYVVQGSAALQRGMFRADTRLERVWYSVLFPFVAPYLPPGALAADSDPASAPRPLGLVLTRATANLLSCAKPPTGGDVYWRGALGCPRAIYIDVPHGAVLVATHPNASDKLQLRAMFMLSPPLHDAAHPNIFVAVLTDPGSDRPRGRICGLIALDEPASGIEKAYTSGTEGDPTLRTPFVHPSTEARIRDRVADFLRLVMAYYFFGPLEARESIAATPPGELRNARPRKGESLFAMTRLQPARDRLGRPTTSMPTSWSLIARQEVAGHFKLQPYGSRRLLRRLIWVDSYERGPEDAPVRPRAIQV